MMGYVYNLQNMNMKL